MNIVQKIEQYDENYIKFCEPIKNNIMNDGKFIRILYSTSNMLLNGIYLLLSFDDVICEKYYSKYKCIFDTNKYKNTIDSLKNIEENILNKFYFQNKLPQLKIYEQIKNGNIKLFEEFNKSSCSFILKISGIWETQFNYGLTYKFNKINE